MNVLCVQRLTLVIVLILRHSSLLPVKALRYFQDKLITDSVLNLCFLIIIVHFWIYLSLKVKYTPMTLEEPQNIARINVEPT